MTYSNVLSKIIEKCVEAIYFTFDAYAIGSCKHNSVCMIFISHTHVLLDLNFLMYRSCEAHTFSETALTNCKNKIGTQDPELNIVGFALGHCWIHPKHTEYILHFIRAYYSTVNVRVVCMHENSMSHIT